MKTILKAILKFIKKKRWISYEKYEETNNLDGKIKDLDLKVDNNQKISCDNHKETRKEILKLHELIITVLANKGDK